MTDRLISHLDPSSEKPARFALVFAGQGNDWRVTLSEALTAGVSFPVRAHLERSQEMLRPVTRELLSVRPHGFLPLEWATDADKAARIDAASPEISVPAITLAQLATCISLQNQGLQLQHSQAYLGHSQGVLGARIAQALAANDEDAVAEVLAIAQLIGAAVHRRARETGLINTGGSAPMMSVQGMPPAAVAAAIDELEFSEQDAHLRPVVGLINGSQQVVAVGRPADLARLAARLSDATVSDLPVRAGFHHPLMNPGVDYVTGWAKECGLDAELAYELADAVMVRAVEWPAAVSAVAQDVDWFLEVGPGRGVEKLTAQATRGTGTGVLSVAHAAGQEALFDLGKAPQRPRAYSEFAPRLSPRGLETAFTRLTGRSPILLAGMTPTTVDPAIVAAAANAGHWAELAGGGQITQEIFDRNVEALTAQLQEGVSAQFNAMFLDPKLWGRHFGTERWVPKARAAGAPIDGVVISAGVPERDQAVELIAALQADGFAYVCFKPGSRSQISQVLAIADATDAQIIMQVEGGIAGGHHSWENLDELLLETYDQIRARTNVVLTVGGGLGTPARAAEYLVGTWATAYGLPAMPVDGVLVGTAAMATRESTATEAVKRALVDAEGSQEVVPAGAARGGVASGLSQLGADIHELDNAFTRAGRLLDEVAGDADQVAARREEIIAALNSTCKPYFGDTATMTYAQWLKRYLELSGPDHRGWLDPSWRQRFVQMCERTQARLDPRDHGEIELLELDYEDAQAAVDKLTHAYSGAERTLLTAADQAWFIRLCRQPGKPVNFVPVIDAGVRGWFRADSLWQAHDEVYGADADRVSIIPGPAAVQGISRIDEPVAELLGRFHSVAIERARALGVEESAHRPDLLERLLAAPMVSWAGRQQANPLRALGGEWTIQQDGARHSSGATLQAQGEESAELSIALPESASTEQTPQLRLLLTLPQTAPAGAVPKVLVADAESAMTDLVTIAAGGGLVPVQEGRAHTTCELTSEYLADYQGVTGGFVPAGEGIVSQPSVVPDALVGLAWPAIFSCLASARVPGEQEARVVEGMLSLVHLTHRIQVFAELSELAGERLDISAGVESVRDTQVGRVVEISAQISHQGEHVADLVERFAIRTRRGADPAPSDSLPDSVVETPQSARAQISLHAPETMEPFAVVSGDRNPIHVNESAARLAGLEGVIVHGMWTSALAEVAASSGFDAAGVRTSPAEIREFTTTMLAPILPGARLDIEVSRVGRDTRPGFGEVRAITVKADGQLALSAHAIMAAETVFYAFPGQGIQSPGMGMQAYAQSAAAREIWDRADAHTRSHLGFSILHIVRENPREVVVDGVRYTHPDGVLFLTQFTQVAMATLGCAQIAELTEAGALQRPAYFAGHSVGEYNALAAYAQVLSLEAVVEIVYRRGRTMHHLVERDQHGMSAYGLAALRPYKMGLSADNVADFVAQVAQASGQFLEIVNYNIAGRQYAVAGTREGLAALNAEAERRAPGAKALVMIPGIDVPFHSSHLLDGVGDFRAHLDELIPEHIDLTALEGYYIPNLVARPFELTEEFIASIAEVVESDAIAALLADVPAALQDRQRTGRTLLIELLAWQFASPVRWIETQDLLLTRLGVDHFVEVGVGASPTLVNMLGQTLNLPQYADSAVTALNLERDRKQVFAEDAVSFAADEDHSEDEPAAATEPAAEPVPAAPVPAPATSAAAASGAETADIPLTTADALDMLLALWTSVRPGDMAPTDTIETLVEGVSSRRNQVLLDLGNEFALGSIDGAADAPLDALRDTVSASARGYKPFGPVLKDAVADALRRLTGPAGKKPTYIAERVLNHWQLGQGWADHVVATVVMGTREGMSLRGGPLAYLEPVSPQKASELDALIDAAIAHVAQSHGITVAPPSAGAGVESMVDSQALNQFAEHITGENGVLATTARTLLDALGLAQHAEDRTEDPEPARVMDLVSRELGPEWPRAVASSFDPRKAVLFDDRWATAREDISRVHHGLLAAADVDVTGAGEAAAQHAEYFGLNDLAAQARDNQTLEFSEDVAVVTGASPNSIAADVVAGLLRGGAVVVATASRLNHDRIEFYRRLYSTHARGGAALWIVPANMASFSDVDALATWISQRQTVTVGASVKETKPALVPTLLFPFAAPRVSGTLADAGATAESQMRLLLWSVERLIAQLSGIGADTHVNNRLHVVLPGSPNRGRFGGDGAYGEAKAALDALVTRWHAEPVWARRTSLVHALIGWVRGTGLMGGNDPLVAAVEDAGVTTFSTAEMSEKLLGQTNAQVRQRAAAAPVTADFTGGLGNADINLAELASQRDTAPQPQHNISPAQVPALPTPRQPLEWSPGEWGSVATSLDQMVVLAGIGELGPYGSSRTRFEAELSDTLSAAGVLELAWSTGLIRSEDGVLLDAEGAEIDESEVYERYHDEVLARCGVRRYNDELGSVEGLAPELTTIYLERDLTFRVDSAEEAQTYVESDPERTRVQEDADAGDFVITRLAGSPIQVPRRTVMSRFVGGQIPTGFDPAVYGIPADMLTSIDRVAVWNLVCAVEAFLSAGFSPAELLEHVHPARVSSTMGTGMGGSRSLRSIYVERLLGQPRANDVLQEALPNVVAAHVMQSYVGGYGQMVHPVAACATAAVSVEEAVDKIRLGKADAVVAGGIDDLSIEGVTGFGNMNATANTSDLEEQGIEHRFVSRPNDRRRGGFVESEGGGVALLVRGSLALKLGLPVQAVVAFAESFADGAHTSIPAPGLGALSAAQGGTDSRLAVALREHGVEADEIAVVSKHDTSTNANDPNESDLHERIARALGRSAGNPLYVVSQKSLTGHAKGGAAAFQLAGLTQVLRTGLIPANRSLDCVDAELAQHPSLVWPRSVLRSSTMLKAGLLTSLGFGHVSALVAVVHPAAFFAAIAAERGLEAAQDWFEAARRRETAALQRLDQAIFAGASLYERPAERNLGPGSAAQVKEREAEVLLDAGARLIDARLRSTEGK
ncbi:type I polyketide synthase [Corynebacterium tapiri]|uniref:type I polyketide synthase n=1 Tax=Corynebacterium tapiri TaxID=1448266 RepID=UPI001FEB8439|nr:type I polyketide synthase [Corynebacterium tapiri]